MRWKVFSFLELSSFAGICLWWSLPFIVTLNDLFSPIECWKDAPDSVQDVRALMAVVQTLSQYTNSNNVVVTSLLWGRLPPPNIRDIQCCDKIWPKYHYIPATRSFVVTIPISSLLTTAWPSAGLEQFVGIFTIFLVWVLELALLSLDLSKWERRKHPVLFKLLPS